MQQSMTSTVVRPIKAICSECKIDSGQTNNCARCADRSTRWTLRGHDRSAYEGSPGTVVNVGPQLAMCGCARKAVSTIAGACFDAAMSR